MKIALVTTTINVPKVLEAYRALGSYVKFFVTLDKKSADLGPYIRDLCERGRGDRNTIVISPEGQTHWKHSELIGWNTDSRRNIAVLEALKWGAEIIVSVDDDMFPYGLDFFERIERTLTQPFSGLELGSPGKWFDAGLYTVPRARQRGLPPGAYSDNSGHLVYDVQIGAMQGIILGTPDTDAATTIANRPFVHSASDVLKAGFVVDPQTKCVFNSQITSFRRDLAPAFAQFYKWQGRNTDIIASLIMRRIMRDRDLYTYFGPPTGFHARAPRDPQLDMNAEQWGLNKIRPLQDYLENTDAIVPGAEGMDQLRRLYEDMLTLDMFPRECVEAMLAWLDDVESVM